MAKENEPTGFEVDQIALAAFEKLKHMAGMIESEEDIIQQCGGLRIRVYEAGEYDKKDEPGVKVPYPEGIELRTGALRLICEASDLAMLAYHMRINVELRNVLRKRLDDEKKLMKELSF